MATKPTNDKSWTEPESAANIDSPPVAPYNNITQTQSGHSFEMDDTRDRERIRLQHRTGTFIEMHPNGDEVHKVYGDGYEIVIKNKNVLIKGHCNITIEGDSIIDIKGDKIERVAGDYNLQVKGQYNVYAEKDLTISTPTDMQLAAGTSIGGGALKLITADHVYISGDVSVAGDFIADLITSTSRVDATTGVSAGPLGFVSVTGGLSIGIPAAFTGQINCLTAINCLGSITAATSVTGSTGNFNIMNAILMTDVINTNIYSSHKHPAPRGVTGPPFTPMV
jgi:hypothetical protein